MSEEVVQDYRGCVIVCLVKDEGVGGGKGAKRDRKRVIYYLLLPILLILIFEG